MTKMIVRTNGGKIRAALQDRTRSLFDTDTAEGAVGKISEAVPSKSAPWVAISTALVPPIAKWLLDRLDRRRGRRLSTKRSGWHRLTGPETEKIARITVRTQNGRLRIRLGGVEKASACSVATAINPKSAPESPESPNRALSISRQLLSLMEIRAESAFRPDQKDLELVYALSGSTPNMPDTLHTLSSNAVVEEASENHIVSCVRGMIEHIQQERDDDIGIIVEVHTHPLSSSNPSEQDRRYFASATQTIQRSVPNAQALFGVHAISRETVTERQQPVLISGNTIRWSSINREHEIAFYSADTHPYDVQIID